ncbi:hypothetical protein ACTRXD_09795 [Nitrospira sp. T9]|uniref:hypothetical protein n=1 Tax=unclassified Nitrospira TaxID=2652172 RepID=UPI003F9DAF3A
MASLLIGCPYHIWEPVGSEVGFSSFQVTTDIPPDWRRFYDGSDDLLISYDGLTLQNIRIREVSLEELIPEVNNEKLSDMAPNDLIAWVNNSSPGNISILKIEVLESVPSTLNGINGKRLLVSGESHKGLRYKQLHYVYFQESRVYIFSFTAVARHYFDRDEPVFEKIRMSFQGTKTSKG